jgi:hypothetical protein
MVNGCENTLFPFKLIARGHGPAWRPSHALAIAAAEGVPLSRFELQGLQTPRRGRSYAGLEQNKKKARVDHRSFRDQLAFSIGFAVTRSRALLRRLLTEHAPDDARQMLAERVIGHLEQGGLSDRRSRARAQEAPGGREPRLARAFGRPAGTSSSAFSSALARCSFFAASLTAVRVVAASSSCSASRSALVSTLPQRPPGGPGQARPACHTRQNGPHLALDSAPGPAGSSIQATPIGEWREFGRRA